MEGHTPVVGNMNFDDVKLPGTTPANNSQQGDAKKKDPTHFWVNVGIKRGGKLLTLPMGIPLDKLEAKTIPGPRTKNVEFRNLRIAEKQFWDSFQAQMQQLQPGESRELNLVVEIRRIDERTEPTEEDITENPFAVGEFKF